MLGEAPEDFQKNMVQNFCREYAEENGFVVKGDGDGGDS